MPIRWGRSGRTLACAVLVVTPARRNATNNTAPRKSKCQQPTAAKQLDENPSNAASQTHHQRRWEQLSHKLAGPHLRCYMIMTSNDFKKIHLYAEFLSNIRQVSAAASLSSQSNSQTRAELSSDGHKIMVRHDGNTSVLTLPAQVNPANKLSIPQPGLTELSWRLPLRASKSPDGRVPPPTSVPWSAMDLAIGSQVSCRYCQQSFIAEGIIKIWKDLPSENWAEMMELWHCHKPVVNGHEDHQHLATRGYGANSFIGGQDGVGLVDLTFLLCSENDATGLKVSFVPHRSNVCAFDPALCWFHGYPEGGRASPLGSQWYGHRYRYPISKLCCFASKYKVSEPEPEGDGLGPRTLSRHFTSLLTRSSSRVMKVLR